MKTAVVIPSYNEKQNLAKIIPQIISLLPNVYIVVVDDNSPDNTRKKITEMQKKYKHLYLINRDKKEGRGSAVIEGFSYAYKKMKADIFIEMDADLSHNPKELLSIIAASRKKTVVIGSRYLPKSRIINWSILRRITSKLSNLLIKILLHLPMSDNTNGYRCYQKDAIKTILSYRFVSRGYMVLSESADVLFKSGFRFVEVPTVFHNRKIGKSNATLREFINSLVNLIQLKTKLNQ